MLGKAAQRYSQVRANTQTPGELLLAIYDFALARLSDANRDAKVAPVEEVIRALTPLREAWTLAVPKAIAEASAKKNG
jgi:flagellin-specific chaperone FliS